MEIAFHWLVNIERPLQESSEAKIKDDIITNHEDFKPCHAGVISIVITSSDPIQVSIKGNIKCNCGKLIASFEGSSDGSTVHYKFP